MNMKSLAFLAVVAFALGASALPSVENQRIRRSRAGDEIEVRYDLKAEDAVVTVQFFKNGTELINEVNYASTLSGDVNRKVAAGEKKSLVWNVPQALRDELGDEESFTVRLRVWPTNSPPTYMVVHLTNNPISVSYYASTNAFPNGFDADYYKMAGLTLRRIPAAGRIFEMGCTRFYGVNGGNNTSRGIRHSVKLTEDYYIGVFEYTYGNRVALYGNPGNKAEWPNEDELRPDDTRLYPTCSRAYTEVRYYTNAKPEYAGKGWPDEGHFIPQTDNPTEFYKLRSRTGLQFDLPTEAQWWIACYGDGSVPFYNGGGDNGDQRQSTKIGSNDTYVYAGIDDYAWTMDNSGTLVSGVMRYLAHPVGQKRPNSYGLYDMLGNVTEWVLDGAKTTSNRFTSLYEDEAVDGLTVDPKGAAEPMVSGTTYMRLYMGGGYNYAACRASPNFRYAQEQSYSASVGDTGATSTLVPEAWGQGFRVACPAIAVK